MKTKKKVGHGTHVTSKLRIFLHFRKCVYSLSGRELVLNKIDSTLSFSQQHSQLELD